MKAKKLTAALTLILFIFTAGACASIPKEAAELSVELGNQMKNLEYSHISLVNKYFKEKRSNIDRFLNDEWVPLLTKKFFENSEVTDAWNSIVTENNETDRAEFLKKAASALQKQVNLKRLELIGPLDELELALERNIRAAYTQAFAINNTLTSFLDNASELTGKRDAYLSVVGVTQKRVTDVIDQTDAAVSDIMNVKNLVTDEVNYLREFKEKIQLLIEQL